MAQLRAMLFMLMVAAGVLGDRPEQDEAVTAAGLVQKSAMMTAQDPAADNTASDQMKEARATANTEGQNQRQGADIAAWAASQHDRAEGAAEYARIAAVVAGKSRADADAKTAAATTAADVFTAATAAEKEMNTQATDGKKAAADSDARYRSTAAMASERLVECNEADMLEAKATEQHKRSETDLTFATKNKESKTAEHSAAIATRDADKGKVDAQVLKVGEAEKAEGSSKATFDEKLAAAGAAKTAYAEAKAKREVAQKARRIASELHAKAASTHMRSEAAAAAATKSAEAAKTAAGEKTAKAGEAEGKIGAGL